MFASFHTLVTNRRGFTLVEALVAGGIFTIVMGVVGMLLFNAFASDRKGQLSKIVYEESRIALERIAKEVRRGTVDYEEYWSWYRQTGSGAPIGDAGYGKNYGNYALQFYRDDAGGGVPTTKDRNDLNVGVNAGGVAIGQAAGGSYTNCSVAKIPTVPSATSYEQCELYLISADGKEKTIFRLQKDATVTPAEYRLAMLRLTGYDCGHRTTCTGARDEDDATDGDGQIDTWLPEDDFAGYTFRPIQPDSINITRLAFFISPLEDPRKAFSCYESGASVDGGTCPTGDIQIQPHVTIILTAVPSASVQKGIRGVPPEITIQTTVAARAENEVVSLK